MPGGTQCSGCLRRTRPRLGVSIVCDACSPAGRAPMVRDLDAQPIPNYRDYFATAAAPGRPDPAAVADDFLGYPQVPIETARGCW